MLAPPLNETTLEKGVTDPVNPPDSSRSSLKQIPLAKRKPPTTFWGKLNRRIETFSNLEIRGIQRVLPDERYQHGDRGYLQIAMFWFSINLTSNNLTLGLLGPLAYGLSFVDSALCAVFGALLGSAGAAYMSTWGPPSGNRTMVVARYFMGYCPSKIACLLNIIIMLGYGMIDCIIGGQILSAVSGGSLSIIVGIVINAVITWVVATFGISLFHYYERYAWMPQAAVLLILIGSAGPKFDTLYSSSGNQETINGDRLSFLSLCLSAPIAWAPSAADYFVYYPENTNRPLMFLMATTGMVLSNSLVYLIGVGLGSGTFTNPTWNDAYSVSSGALILQGYEGLGGFGKFCGVVLSLGLIANNIPGTYSAALGFQVMGRYLLKLPRWFWVCVSVVIYTVCAIGGRNNIFDIFENFLALMGYWVTIFLAIVIEEQAIFKRKRGYDWERWQDRSYLPIGIAALTAFLIGWVGAIISMDQVWYVGPLAKMVGEYGGDLGIWVGTGWALIVYPPLRALELSRIGR